MSYTPGVPLSGQFLGNTRAAINSNFQVIQTWTGTDHFALNATNAGKHKFVRMPVRTTVAPSASGELSIFTKTGTSPAESNLYYAADNNTSSIYQLTRTDNAHYATFGKNVASGTQSRGWTFLPGGLLMMYGSKTSPGPSGTVNFPFTFPGGAPYSIQLSVISNKTDTIVTLEFATPPTASSFKYNIQNGQNVTLYWVAIGI